MTISNTARVTLGLLALVSAGMPATPAGAVRNGLIVATVSGPCIEYSLNDCEDPELGVITVRPDGSGARRLPVPLDSWRPKFSSDGRYLAFLNGSGRIAVSDPRGEHRRWISPVNGGWRNFDWSPSGHTLAWSRPVRSATRTEDTVFRMNVSAGPPRRIGPGADPVWSPNGDWIAFLREIVRPESSTRIAIMVMRPDGGDARQVGVTRSSESELRGWTADGHEVIYSSGNAIQFVDVRTGHRRQTRWAPRRVISPDGRLEVTTSVNGLFVGPVHADRRSRILGPPTRWKGTVYLDPDWQPLP